jgi:hypothetical protein
VALLLSVDARYAGACVIAHLVLVKAFAVKLEAPGLDAIAYHFPRVSRRRFLPTSGKGTRVPSKNVLDSSGAFSVEATFSGSVLAIGTGALNGASATCFEAVAVEFDAIRPRTAASGGILLKWTQVQRSRAKEFQAAWIAVGAMVISWLHALRGSWLVVLSSNLLRDHRAMAEGLGLIVAVLHVALSFFRV